jgi:hypothetical protein
MQFKNSKEKVIRNPVLEIKYQKPKREKQQTNIGISVHG